jgi:hypothetical protein
MSVTPFFTDSGLSVNDPIAIDLRHCRFGPRGQACDPARRNPCYPRQHKESHHAGAKRLNRIALANTIEELIWQAVNESLRNP